MNGRAISWSIGHALAVLGLAACACSCASTSSGVAEFQPSNTPTLASGGRCLELGSECGNTYDCCSELCQNGYCEEQPGGD
jgi:hypothetical protein